jgi:hypothetical protein
VAQWSGERLELRQGGRGLRQDFRQRVRPRGGGCCWLGGGCCWWAWLGGE